MTLADIELYFSERSSDHLQRLQYQLNTGRFGGLDFANEIIDTGKEKCVFQQQQIIRVSVLI